MTKDPKNSNHALMASGKKGGKGKQKKKKDGTKEKPTNWKLYAITAINQVTNNLNAGPKVVEKKAKVLGKRNQLKPKRLSWLSWTMIRMKCLHLHAHLTMQTSQNLSRC